MRRLVVISDLHIGGPEHPMLGHPEVLTDFLGQLAGHPGAIEKGVARVVVMGHTHLARDIPLPGDGRYINTGTWADLIRIDKALLADTDDARAALSGWLQKLADNRLNGIREHMPRYADVEVDDAGHVRSARLRKHGAGDRFA